MELSKQPTHVETQYTLILKDTQPAALPVQSASVVRCKESSVLRGNAPTQVGLTLAFRARIKAGGQMRAADYLRLSASLKRTIPMRMTTTMMLSMLMSTRTRIDSTHADVFPFANNSRTKTKTTKKSPSTLSWICLCVFLRWADYMGGAGNRQTDIERIVRANRRRSLPSLVVEFNRTSNGENIFRLMRSCTICWLIGTHCEFMFDGSTLCRNTPMKVVNFSVFELVPLKVGGHTTCLQTT